MAGSYNHTVNDEGKLIAPEDMAGMLETGGDVYEAVEEMYGMIWYLATKLNDEYEGTTANELVEEARQQYREGLVLSPGLADPEDRSEDDDEH